VQNPHLLSRAATAAAFQGSDNNNKQVGGGGFFFHLLLKFSTASTQSSFLPFSSPSVLSCKQKLSKPKHVPEFRDYVVEGEEATGRDKLCRS
jgi:hypothetical protein